VARIFQLRSAPPPSRLGIDYASALNAEQRAVAVAPREPLLVLAAAGSGKTRALTYRVARFIDEGVEPERILLLTFTNRAAREMLDRVAALVGPASQRVMGGTFHHVGNAILRTHARAVGYEPTFGILDREDARAVMEAAVLAAKVDVKKERFPKADVLLDVASFTLNTLTPARDVLLKRAPRFAHLADPIMEVCRCFVQKKAERNLMDFDDLLTNWRLLLEEGGRLAEHVRGGYDAVLVDEYQDTDALQGRIVDLMAERHRNVTAVGDDAQCIYGFRGARVENMRTFAERWSGARLLPLGVNFRSTPQILDVANTVLDKARDGFKTKLIAVRQPGVLPALVPCRDAPQQAAFIAERILELRDEGVGLDDVAVLYRAHKNALELQVELSRRGIPYLVRSGLRFFEQAHIKDVVAHLRWLHNGADELSFTRVVKLHDGVGNATAAALWTRLREETTRGAPIVDALEGLLLDEGIVSGAMGRRVRPALARFTALVAALHGAGVKDRPAELIRVLLERFYADWLLAKMPNGKERAEEIQELADYAAGFEDLEAFLSELALVQSFSAEEIVAAETPDERVTLSSVHQAKGLEWSRVFVMWLTEGVFPSELALKDDGGEDEERRLFYVAVTRAKDELYLCHPIVTRGRDQAMVLHRGSRFLDELDDGQTEAWQIEVASDPALPATPALALIEGGLLDPRRDGDERLLEP
jgi:DNA helicase-2/ATP-dependent DNA helicase PcrA